MNGPASLAAALALAACATVPPGRPAAASIDRLQRGYEAARAIADLFAPYLPPGHAARLVMLSRAVERALIAARTATGTAARAAALDRAAAATGAYRHAADQ